MTVVLLRCVVPHWQGDTFIPLGAIRRKGHPEVIDQFFEPYELDTGDAPEPKPARRPRSK